MLIVGLTGKTGAGKGEFCKAAEKYSEIAYLDTDITARKVSQKGSECLCELCDYFGTEILKDDGTLNRKHLAKIAFSDEEKHAKLNQITHKYIMKNIKEWLTQCQKDEKLIAIIDAPLLFESGAHKLCDKIVSVMASEEIRRERIIKRDHIDEKDADIRIHSQKCDSFYIERSDYVLYNDGERDSFVSECENVMKKLLSEAKLH